MVTKERINEAPRVLNESQPRADGAPDVSSRMPDSVAKVVEVPVELADALANRVPAHAQESRVPARVQENKALADAQGHKVLADAPENRVPEGERQNSVPADVEVKTDLKNVPLAVANRNSKDAGLVTAEEVAKTISSTEKKTSLVELVEMRVANRVLKLNRSCEAGFKRNEMMIGERNESSPANQRNLVLTRRSHPGEGVSRSLKDAKADAELVPEAEAQQISVPADVEAKTDLKNVLLAVANRNSKDVKVGAVPVPVDVEEKIVANSSHLVAVEASRRAMGPGKKELVVVGAGRNLKGEKADAETLPEEEAQQESVLADVGAKKVGKNVRPEVADASKNLMAMGAKAVEMPIPEVEDEKPKETTSGANSNSTVVSNTRKTLPVLSTERTLSSRI